MAIGSAIPHLLPRFIAQLDVSRGTVSEFQIRIIELITRVLAMGDGSAAIARINLADRFGAILRCFPRNLIL
jgi:hypothetical protein